MSVDGEIDPKSYSRDQLVGALHRINRERYPLNYRILSAELASRPSEIPSVEEPVAPSISLGRVVTLSGLMWAGYTGAIVAYSLFAPPLVPPKAPWLTVAVLVAIVHICGWMVPGRRQGKLSKPDLARIAQGCAITFVAVDSGLPLLLEWSGLSAAEPTVRLRDVLTGIVTDVVIVLLVVYLTLPILSKLYDRRRAT